MSADLKCSPREASDCPIFGLCNCGHVHVTTTSGVDDINDLWLPFRRDLQTPGDQLKKALRKRFSNTLKFMQLK